MSIEIKAAALANAIECPVSLEPLTQAVTLNPCLHKINETAANQLFGGPIKKGARLCPICRIAVKGWKSDPVIRDIVCRAMELLDAVASLKKADTAHLEEETGRLEICADAPAKEEAPAAADTPQRAPVDEDSLSHLGERVVSGDLLRHPCGWGQFSFTNSSFCYGRLSLEFERVSGDSPITRFTFFSEVNVSMKLEFLCEENGTCTPDLFKYLQSLSLLRPLPSRGSTVYETSCAADVRKLLTMFKEFNDVPSDCWDQMDVFVASAERREAAGASLAPTAT